MSASSSSARASAAFPSVDGGRLRQLPEAAQAAYRAFTASGDVAQLDRVIFAIVEQYAPRKATQAVADLPGSTLLMQDLGLDSLGIIEMVFFIEELFEVSIANEEIVPVRTLDDLRGFIRVKVASRVGA